MVQGTHHYTCCSYHRQQAREPHPHPDLFVRRCGVSNHISCLLFRLLSKPTQLCAYRMTYDIEPSNDSSCEGFESEEDDAPLKRQLCSLISVLTRRSQIASKLTGERHRNHAGYSWPQEPVSGAWSSLARGLEAERRKGHILGPFGVIWCNTCPNGNVVTNKEWANDPPTSFSNQSAERQRDYRLRCEGIMLTMPGHCRQRKTKQR